MLVIIIYYAIVYQPIYYTNQCVRFVQEIVLEMLKEAILAKAPTSKGFLIDGYPRDLKQGQSFEDQVNLNFIYIYI